MAESEPVTLSEELVFSGRTAGEQTMKIRHQAFIAAYLGEAHGNATRAAITAGYSERTARQQGSRLLSNVDIQAALAERMTEAGMTADQAIERLSWYARQEPDNVRAADSVKSLELILRAHGIIGGHKDRASRDVVVNIGFLKGIADAPTTITVPSKGEAEG